jgi:hypothetical protein
MSRFLNWLRKCSWAKRTRAGAIRRPARGLGFHPALGPLEDRCLLSTYGVGTVTYQDPSSGAQCIYAFERGWDGYLHVNYWDGASWHWANQGAPSGTYVAGDPGVVTYRDATNHQRIYAFVLAGNGHLEVNYWDGAWHWADQGTPSGTTMLGTPGVITYVDGTGNQRIYAFAEGANGHLEVNYWQDGAWHWADQGTPSGALVNGSPGVITYMDGTGNQRIYAFAEGANGHLEVNYWGGFSWAWADQGWGFPQQSTQLVNNPGEDTTSQDTQSETSLLVAGSTVLVAYNDSEENAGASHFTGFSQSTNDGASFRDMGALPASANGDGGDPVLARNNASGATYLATLSFLGDNIQFFTSTNNGATFGAPVNSSPGIVGVDKPWLTVDNFTGPGQGTIYQTLTSFGSSTSIVLTRSTNGGTTWGPNGGVTLATGTVQGSNVVVGPDHSVYVFWLDQNSGTRILMRRSTDHGQTFGAAVTVATLKTTRVNGDLGLNGGFRTNAFPQAAVNPVTGSIYLVFNDQGQAAGDKADVYFTQSTNNGAAWSSPTRVNNDAGTNDQWMPALAVTPDGSRLFVTWYDRRLDAANSLIDRFGVIATISGSSVSFGANFRLTESSFPPVVGQDPAINPTYMGDYDQAAADNFYFYTTWGDNRLGDATHTHQPDVRFAAIPVTGFPFTGHMNPMRPALAPAAGKTEAPLASGSSEPGATAPTRAETRHLGGLAPFTLTAARTASADQQPVAQTPPRATPSALVPATIDWLFGMAQEGAGTFLAPAPGRDDHGRGEAQPVASGSAAGTGVAALDTLFFAPGARAQDDLTDGGRFWHGEDLRGDGRPLRSEELADLLFARAWEPLGSAN